MKLSLFKIGLVITVIGISGIWLEFAQNEIVSNGFSINSLHTKSLEFNLPGNDIGFYRVTILDFEGNSVFVQIIDPNENVVADKKLETRMSVNYFDSGLSGKYVLKVTNISDSPIKVDVDVGQINSEKMIYPGIIFGIGFLSILMVTYQRLRNYKIAQPDENIS